MALKAFLSGQNCFAFHRIGLGKSSFKHCCIAASHWVETRGYCCVVTNLIGLCDIFPNHLQSFASPFLNTFYGLFPRWIHSINPKDLGNEVRHGQTWAKVN